MSEEKPVRRRRRQAVEMEKEKAAEQTPTIRIVAREDDQPEWMVTASEVSGAAKRRSAKPRAPQEQEAPNAPETPEPQEARPRASVPEPKAPARTRPPAEAAQAAASAPRPASPRKAAAPKAASARKPVEKPTQKPSKKLSKKERERRARVARRTTAGVLAGAVLIALAAVAAIGVGRLVDIKNTLDRGDGVFYQNIYVNDIALEGRTLDEAASVVTKQVQDLISNWKITLRTQDGRTWDIGGQDVSMQYDVADQLDQLWAIGHSGSSSDRYKQVKALEEEEVRRYTTLNYDLTNVEKILTQVKSEVDQPPISATKVPDDTKWPPYSYTDDVPGLELDVSGLSEKIAGMVDRLESGVIDLTPTPVDAPTTRAYLESQIVQLSSYDTTVASSSEPGRFINIRVGTEKFNHLVIKPGESVSFNKVTGLRNYQNGYADAPEIAYGEYVTGVGGGICQVSSTLYNAVVNAGLEVTKRTQHSHASSYVPYGLDATVQDNRLDFVFRNNTDAELFITAEYYEKGRTAHCRFTLHGRPDPNGYSYKLESQVVETIPIPEPEYRKDTEAQYVVYDDEEYQTRKGAEGYVVDIYRVTMDKNGMEVERKLDHTDTYGATTPVIYVGVTPRETPAPDYY